VGKVKAEFSTAQYFKKQFDKDNFEKIMWRNTVAKQKYVRTYCNNPLYFKEKNYEVKSIKII